MPISKTIETKSGVTSEYQVVEQLRYDNIEDELIAVVGLYFDQTSFEEDKDPISVFRVQFSSNRTNGLKNALEAFVVQLENDIEQNDRLG